MKYILGLLALFSSAFAEYEFDIQPNRYWFSSHYDIYSGGKYLSSVENDWMQLHTVWSVCDEKGEYATGTARLLSLGAVSNAMREIDIVDYHQKQLGYIQGHWWTSAAGKFVFYDQYEHPYAIAYVDQSKASVKIVDFVNQRLPIAVFTRWEDVWNIKVHNEEVIDPRVLYVFSAFVSDAYRKFVTRDTSGGTFWDTLNLLIILDSLRDDR